MIRLVFVLTVCALITGTTNAQPSNNANVVKNPFANLQFVNAYKDTITLRASYSGITGITSSNDIAALTQIKRLYGVNDKKYQNAVAFTFDGLARKFYMPYREKCKALLLLAKPNDKMMLKCVVYRFFTIDGSCNFFYIDDIKI